MKFAKYFAVMFLIGAALYAQESANKVPDSFAVRLLKVQKDQITLQAEIQALTQRYQADTQTLQHDNDELDQIKSDAIKSTGRDPKTTDIDLDKLEFIAKAAPPPAAPTTKK
jgi:hypothetical protein